MIDFLADFSQNFSERALFALKNSITKIGIVELVTLKKPCLFHADFNQDFLHSGTWLADFNHDFNHENRHSGTDYIEIAMLLPCRFQSGFQSRFSA